MIDHLRALAIFAKVAESGSFRGAARTLGLSPSVVSQQVSALEARLGVALIYRSTRKLSLTPDGESLLTSAQAMTEAAEAGLSQFSGKSAEPVGVLRLAVPAILVSGPFVETLGAFAQAHPGIALRISFSDMRRDIIGEGFDLALRVGWLSDSALKASKIGETARCLVASPDYIARHKTPRRPADLDDWQFIRFEPLPDAFALRHPKRGTASVSGRAQISVDSSEAMHRFALAGAGVAALLRFTAQESLETGRLVELLPSWRLASAGIFAVSPSNAPRNGVASRLVAYLRSNLKIS